MSNNFLLIHGAWQGAWAWSKVKKILSQRGFFVKAIDLPGSGSDKTPAEAVSIDLYVKEIINFAKSMPSGKITLVGHSMGGMAITAAASAEPLLFDKLIYLCAFLPRNGESVLDLANQARDLYGISGPKIEMKNNFESFVTKEEIEEVFFNDYDNDDLTLASSQFRAQSISPIITPIAIPPEFSKIEKYYIKCERDKVIPYEMQDLMRLRAGIQSEHVLDSGHEPFWTTPCQLSEILIDINTN